jgi:diguanylate cyclase (GGDEF)-like protein
MLPAARLDPDDFPDSVYARELRSGISRLRFDAELEPQYIEWHLQRVRLRVRAWFSLSLLLGLLFTVSQTLRTGLWGLTFWVHCLGIVPCSLALFALAWSARYERYYLPAARWLIPLLGALIAVFVAQADGEGRDEELAVLTLNVVAAFFFAGLLYRSALIAATAIIASFTLSSLYFALLTPFEMLKSVLVLVLTALIAAIIYADIERAYRRNYVESGLIAELTARDGLTGLTNRGTFDEHLARVWHQAQRERRTLAILIADIDNFKSYNDTYGHLAGDAALRRVGQVLKGFARRPLDVAARFGGEEFAIVLYDLPLANVLETADRMRQAVQSAAPPKHPAAGTGVTISLGVGLVTPTPGRTPQGAVQLADEALYEAKNSGRNRIVLKGVEEYRALKTGSFKSAR